MLELLLADSRTPSGGYAHSGGLEAAVGEGLGVAGIAGFVRARLRTVGLVDASIAAASAIEPDIGAWLALDHEWSARTPAGPVRAAARQMGLSLLRVARRWWPADELLPGYARASELTPRPVALGAVAQVGALAPLAAARLSLYEDAAGTMSAAAKLLPIDTADASGWLAALGPELEDLARQAVAEGIASTSTPLLDRRALAHAHNERKLFAS